MADTTTILQSTIVAKFILPFLLVFFIIFAILEKTKVLGGGKQIDALVAFIVGLIFVGFAYPKDVVSNLILFMTVAIVVVFVVLILWGFFSGGEGKIEGKGIKMLGGIVLVVAVIIAILWATGTWDNFTNLFRQSWSETFWTNVFFIIVIAAALAAVLVTGKKSG